MTANVSRLKIARITAGMNQFDLARLVGVNEVTISRIETRRQEAPRELKEKISAVLGKPAFELFDR